MEINVFEIVYTVAGGLGIFFLGLRFLSDSLQSITGDLIKKIINYATINRFVAVLAGFLITSFVQSSSISTVMVIGLVNAGLMKLTQAIGVILGANIGTTMTGWILAINIGKYGLLLIGLGIFPMLFSRRERLPAYGKVCVALGLVFLGLELMSGAFVPLRSHEGFLTFLQLFDTSSTVGLLGCVLVGCVLTCLIQSSSAMLGITIALATTGSLTYSTAAGLVLGENIGTTITALLASIGTTVSARRAALSHALFNVTGVAIMVLVFPLYISMVDSLVPGDPDTLLAETKPYIAAHIAMGHSIFNITATLLMLPFLTYFARFVEWLIPGKEAELHHLRYIKTPGYASTGISLNMAALELQELVKTVKQGMALTRQYVHGKKHDRELYDQMKKLEESTDSVQKEITSFICQVMEGSLSNEQSSEAYSLIRAADELESITDYCQALCRFRYRLHRYEQDFSEDGWRDVYDFFDGVAAFFDSVVSLTVTYDEDLAAQVPRKADALSRHADELRDHHLGRMRDGSCKPLPALAFSDIVVAMRRIKNHTVNLFEAIRYAYEPPELTFAGKVG